MGEGVGALEVLVPGLLLFVGRSWSSLLWPYADDLELLELPGRLPGKLVEL